MKYKKVMFTLIGIFVSIFFVYLTFKNINISKLITVLLTSNLYLIFFAFCLNVIDVIFRGFKWHVILNKKVGYVPAIKSSCLGYATNNLFPIKIGELFKAYYLKKHNGIRNSLGAIALERTIEGLTLVFLLGVLIIFLINNSWLQTVFLTGLFVFLFLFIFLIFILIKKSVLWKILHLFKLQFLIETMDKFITGFSQIKNLNYLTKVIVLSFSVWFLQSITFFIISLSIGLNLEMSVVLLVVCIANLATVIPSGPGGIGILEFAVMSLLSFFFVSSELALGYALLIRFVLVSSSLFIMIVIIGKDIFKYNPANNN